MYYKEDWNKAEERMRAFWEGEVVDRCCIGILAPRRGSTMPQFPELQWGPWLGNLDQIDDQDSRGLERWWTDPEENYKRMITWFENTAFIGEACPATYVNWGASAMACIFGSPPVFGKKSVWYPQVIKDWEQWEWHLEDQADSWWGNILAIQQYLVDRSEGRYFLGTPELGPASDVLTLMRGMDNLSLDLLDYPDQVKKAVAILSKTWVDLHEQLHLMNQHANQGSGVLAWMNLWAPGRHDQLACDFSSAISPAMFKEFFADDLRTMGSWCEYATYHMDGPQCIGNMLDEYLEIAEIDCIEFTPGVNSPPTSHAQYLPLYRKIQQAGKKLYLLVKPGEIEVVLRELSPKGLLLRTEADTEEDALDMLRLVERMSVQNR